MAIRFLQLAQKILQDENRAMTALEIWRIAQQKGDDKLVKTKGKTPLSTLRALIYIDVRDNPNSVFSSIGDRPKRFFLKQ